MIKRIHQAIALLIPLLFVQPIFGQASMNMTLEGTWDGNTIAASSASDLFYNDIWGYVDDANNEYAILGSPNKVHFVDVTTPASPNLVAEFTGGSASIWRDMKTYDRYVYAVADEGNEGLIVFDMNGLPSSDICIVYQSNTDFNKAHNIYIDVPNGRLYVAGSDTESQGLWIYDIATNPANPTLLASPNLSAFNNLNVNTYVHDLFVRDNIAYCSHIYSGYFIMWDVTNPAAPSYIASYESGSLNHSNWIFDDETKIIFAEESTGEPLVVLDITNAANDDLQLVSSFKFPLISNDPNLIYHNPFILGDFAIVSSYMDGVTIIDISNPTNASLVAYYDTWPNTAYTGTDGCWGVYPYLPSGNIIGIDTQTGLYVLSTSVALPTTECNNGVKDPFEEGIDCGGFCKPCGTAGVSSCPAPTCSDGILNQDETGVDCGGAACPACPNEVCDTYDFTGQVISYSNQDNGTFDVQDAGATVYITGNGWKAVPLNYTVSPVTVLEFDFKSDTEGEIHEISFDNDLNFSPDQRFSLYGTQIANPSPAYNGSGNYQHFTIPIGANFTGTYQYLVLTADHDVANPTGDSYFKNIQIYEDYDGNLTCANPTSPCPSNETFTGTLVSGSYQASNQITSSGQIGATTDVTYAGNLICLDSGFEVALGGSLLAAINPCTPFTSTPNSLTATISKAQSNKSTETTLQIHPLGDAKAAYVSCHIPTTGMVEVYLQNTNQEKIKTIFSGYQEAGYTRFRMDNQNLTGLFELVLKTEEHLIKEAFELKR